MQRVEIIGHLGNDPTLRYNPDGSEPATFSVAVSRGKDRDGNPRRPIWYRVTAWGKLAENCNEFLKKGKLVYVAGYLTAGDDGYPRLWKRQDETISASFELTATQVEFLSPKDEGVSTETPVPEGAPAEEDIPF